MKLIKTRITLIMLLAVILIASSALMVSATTRDTDKTTASAGNSMVMVRGSFKRANTKEILDMINKYRLEACKKGLAHPTKNRKLTMDDYKPVKWSADLEWIAQTRAAEGVVLWDHDRPNGTECFTCEHNGVETDMECLAWDYYGSPSDGPGLWYVEKGFYEDGYTDYAGHYAAMIDPDVNYVAVGCFSVGESTCISGEFSFSECLDEKQIGVSGKYDQWMEVKSSHLSGYSVYGSSKVVKGQKATYRFARKATFSGGFDESDKISTMVFTKGGGSWKVSNKSIASISSTGQLKGKKTGKVTVQGKAPNGKTVSKTIKVVKPYKGAELIIKGARYKVTKVNKELMCCGVSGTGTGTVKIPGSVKYYGKKYKVTAVKDSALKGNNTVTSLVIGKNVKKIGKDAFRNCKSLGSVNIKSKYLNASGTGANAFKGSPVRIVKCPSGKKSAYRKFLLKKGIPNSAVFK